MTAVAQTKGSADGLVLVRRTSKGMFNRKRWLLETAKNQSFFLEIREIFLSSTVAELICEHVNLLMHHVLGISRFLKETEVAAIAGQVSV